MSTNQKDVVNKLASKLGFHQVSIGSLEPLAECEELYRDWIDRGYAASMEYMKRDPDRRLRPAGVLTGSKSVILATVSYYSEKPELSKPFWGSVARYAVGLDYHAVFRAKMREFRDLLAKELDCQVSGKPYIDDVSLLEQGLANRHGLGFIGKNSLVITPKLQGSYCFVGELFVDLELEADHQYVGTCGSCFRCGVDCPTAAITEPGYVDSNRCISFLTIENKGGIPLALRTKLGDWVFGCDICQEVCPYNQRPLQTPWPEFEPESGVGHFIDLEKLLTIKSEEEYRKKYFHSPIRRPKRRGMLRNALCVLGNHLFELRNGSKRWTMNENFDLVLGQISNFIKEEPDSMLREHGYWALFQAGEKKRLVQLLPTETDETNKECLTSYLSKM